MVILCNKNFSVSLLQGSYEAEAEMLNEIWIGKLCFTFCVWALYGTYFYFKINCKHFLWKHNFGPFTLAIMKWYIECSSCTGGFKSTRKDEEAKMPHDMG